MQFDIFVTCYLVNLYVHVNKETVKSKEKQTVWFVYVHFELTTIYS